MKYIRKITILFFILTSFLNANSLNEKINNIIGPMNYTKHENLINLLFQNQSLFYNDDNSLRFNQILKILKDNGLLELTFSSPMDLYVEFNISHNPLKSLMILNDTLKSLGYYYYFTTDAKKIENEKFIWKIKLNTEYAIDPFVFLKELQDQNIFIEDISRHNNTSWIYNLNTLNANTNQAIKITQNEGKTFNKPLESYFIEIESGNSLEILSSARNNWRPHIVFYDQNMHTLSVTSINKIKNKFILPIEEGAKYVKIGDKFTILNIKRGLSIIVRNKSQEQ